MEFKNESDTKLTSRRRLSSLSFAGKFCNVDGINRRESSATLGSQDNTEERDVKNSIGGTDVEILSDGWYEDDKSVMQAKEFDENVLSKLKTLEESHMLLRRTRAVSALASRLMSAPDEQACYDEVSRLLVVSESSLCIILSCLNSF